MTKKTTYFFLGISVLVTGVSLWGYHNQRTARTKPIVFDNSPTGDREVDPLDRLLRGFIAARRHIVIVAPRFGL